MDPSLQPPQYSQKLQCRELLAQSKHDFNKTEAHFDTFLKQSPNNCPITQYCHQNETPASMPPVLCADTRFSFCHAANSLKTNLPYSSQKTLQLDSHTNPLWTKRS